MACSCIPFRATEALTNLFEELLVPIDNGKRQALLQFILVYVFGDHRMFTRENLRDFVRPFYRLLDVTGDAIPEAAIGRLIDLPMGRHARAIEIIDNMLARPNGIAVDDQQEEELSDISSLTSLTEPQTAGVEVDAQVDDSLPGNDGINDDTEDNTVALVLHDWSRDAQAQEADNDRSSKSFPRPVPVDNHSLGLFEESIDTIPDP
jgi:hypothetical protein